MMARDWVQIEAVVAVAEEKRTRTGPLYLVSFVYESGGTEYVSRVKSRTPYEPGDAMQVRYDPRNPSMNNMVAFEQKRHRAILLAASMVGLLLICAVLLKL